MRMAPYAAEVGVNAGLIVQDSDLHAAVGRLRVGDGQIEVRGKTRRHKSRDRHSAPPEGELLRLPSCSPVWRQLRAIKQYSAGRAAASRSPQPARSSPNRAVDRRSLSRRPRRAPEPRRDGARVGRCDGPSAPWTKSIRQPYGTRPRLALTTHQIFWRASPAV